MQTSPNVSGMMRLLEAQVATADEPRRGELELMRALVRQRTKNLPRYTCQNCGFRARLFYWQCPAAAAGKPMHHAAPSDHGIGLNARSTAPARMARPLDAILD